MSISHLLLFVFCGEINSITHHSMFKQNGQDTTEEYFLGYAKI